MLEVCRSRTAVMYDAPDEQDGAPSNGRVPNSMSMRCFPKCPFTAVELSSCRQLSQEECSTGP